MYKLQNTLRLPVVHGDTLGRLSSDRRDGCDQDNQVGMQGSEFDSGLKNCPLTPSKSRFGLIDNAVVSGPPLWRTRP